MGHMVSSMKEVRSLGTAIIREKIAIIEEIREDGIKILSDNPNYEYEIINDSSEQNLIKKLPEFDACTLKYQNLTLIY